MTDKPLIIACVHCGNEDRTLISKWIEPANQIDASSVMERKWYCELCGRTWVVRLEGPKP